MKTFLIAAIALLISSASFSQTFTDVVLLKDGTTIKCEIIEQHPLDSIIVKTPGGTTFVYHYDQIEKITRDADKVNSNTNSNYFTINSPFKKTTYGTRKITSYSWKELKGVLAEPNDPELNADIKKLSAKSSVSTACLMVGSLGLGVGVGMNSAGLSQGLVIAGVGLGIEIVGAIASSGAVPLQKKMMTRYNQLKGAPIGFSPMLFQQQNKTAFGFNFNLNF